MKISALLIALLAGVAAPIGPAAAHDFWLQPATFRAETGAPVAFSFQVGHGADRQRWSGRMERVVMLRTISPDGAAIDRRAALSFSPTGDGVLTFATAGAHVIAFESNHANSTLPAARFNAYLAEEGLTPGIRHRTDAGLTNREGREIYSRRAKAVICIGGAENAHVTNAVGLTLEIVPERNPCTLPADEALPVRVYYQGQPLAGALVKLTNLDVNMRTLSHQVSDGEGRAAFRYPRTGSWLLNVVWTRPLDGHASADFETVFSSLTFGGSPPLGKPPG